MLTVDAIFIMQVTILILLIGMALQLTLRVCTLRRKWQKFRHIIIVLTFPGLLVHHLMEKLLGKVVSERRLSGLFPNLVAVLTIPLTMMILCLIFTLLAQMLRLLSIILAVSMSTWALPKMEHLRVAINSVPRDLGAILTFMLLIAIFISLMFAVWRVMALLGL